MGNTFAKYGLIALVIIALAGLAGWYYLLQGKTEEIDAANAGRGIGQEAPQASMNGSTSGNNSADAGGGSSGGIPGGTIPSMPGITYTGSQPAGNTRGVDLPIGAEAVGGAAYVGDSSVSKFKTPRLWNLAKMPVAGFGFVTSATSTPKIYYVERATGYLFYVDAGTGAVTRLSNTLMPKTYEALISLDGSAILRTSDSSGVIASYSASSTKPSANGTPQPLKGNALDRNITTIAGFSNGPSIFYVQQQGEKSVGYTAQWDGTKKKQVFSSPLGNWRTFYVSDNELYVAQKAEDGVPGYAYKVEKDGHLTPRVRGVPGLTVLPKSNSSAMLYGSSDGAAVSMYAIPGDNAPTISLPIKTSADKCVWAGKGLLAYCAVPNQIRETNYLHERYVGVTHGEDAWWKVDAATGTTALFFSDRAPGETGIDVQDPVMDPTGNYILFKNATDQSLWLLRIPV